MSESSTRIPVVRTTAVKAARANANDNEFDLIYERLVPALRQFARGVLRKDGGRRITLQETILVHGALLEYVGRLDPWLQKAGLPTFRQLLDEDMESERLDQIIDAIAPPLVDFMVRARIDAHRKRDAKKRGGTHSRVSDFDFESLPFYEGPEDVAAGNDLIQTFASGKATDYTGPDQKRASKVMHLLILGYKPAEIAAHLGIATKTVTRDRSALHLWFKATWPSA